ncbi:hypothetical protein EDC19_2401 [Natranaerovirga hydrolytica]|uniref:Uncharacterized protein n=1 Tax=Natranaerovirga hydrolytica TaxID=680378 RepID=A0A4R1MFV6_9FIRM|nr:hypothetical protein [Natranaerovirga hydrolytica]TCK90632.1 hypothetical protein EDC19_2401 [Natranaerovirga hydrolytica]
MLVNTIGKNDLYTNEYKYSQYNNQFLQLKEIFVTSDDEKKEPFIQDDIQGIYCHYKATASSIQYRLLDEMNNMKLNPANVEEEIAQEGMIIMGRVANMETDEKYVDAQTGYTYYVDQTGRPYMSLEERQRLREACEANGENHLKKFLEITGRIQYIGGHTTILIADNGMSITSDKDTLFIPSEYYSHMGIMNLIQKIEEFPQQGNYTDRTFWNEIL